MIPDHESFEIVSKERANYPVALLCRMLGVSKSGYYAWRSRPPSERRRQDALLTEKIREIHSRSHQTYGYPRVHAELRSLGIGCGRRRVARLMRAAGLRGCMRGKRRTTTRRDPRAAPAPDLLGRDFVAGRPNRIWLADITYTYRLRKASSTWPSSWTPTREGSSVGRWAPT
jgi:putative transposase